MIRSPKNAIDRINIVIRAWSSLRPDKSISGMTLEQFREAVKPSADIRVELEDLEKRKTAGLRRRAAADTEALKLVQAIVHAIKGDREEGGEDGELYAAMGFVPKSARGTGLTRRRDKEVTA